MPLGGSKPTRRGRRNRGRGGPPAPNHQKPSSNYVPSLEALKDVLERRVNLKDPPPPVRKITAAHLSLDRISACCACLVALFARRAPALAALPRRWILVLDGPAMTPAPGARAWPLRHATPRGALRGWGAGPSIASIAMGCTGVDGWGCWSSSRKGCEPTVTPIPQRSSHRPQHNTSARGVRHAVFLCIACLSMFP